MKAILISAITLAAVAPDGVPTEWSIVTDWASRVGVAGLLGWMVWYLLKKDEKKSLILAQKDAEIIRLLSEDQKQFIAVIEKCTSVMERSMLVSERAIAISEKVERVLDQVLHDKRN